MENTLKGYISSLRDNVLSRKVFLIATVLFCGFFMTAIPAHATITEVELVVDKITSNKTFATPGGGYENGWQWTFDITVPENEPMFSMKFSDLMSGRNGISVKNNVRFYSAESMGNQNADNAILLPKQIFIALR